MSKFLDDHFQIVHITGTGKAKAVPLPTELTPEGEQYIIPGTEKRAPATPGSQMDLWSDK